MESKQTNLREKILKSESGACWHELDSLIGFKYNF